MSNRVFPSLPGRALSIGRTEIAPAVTISTALSGREYRSRTAVLPRRRYTLTYNHLRARLDHLQQLVGFFAAHGGPLESFLFTDPDDCIAQDEPIAVTDGVTQQWQLVRTWGGYSEPVREPAQGVLLMVDGEPAGSGWALSSEGVITCTSLVDAGHALTWSGRYYQRVRFANQELSLERIVAAIYSGRSVDLITLMPEPRSSGWPVVPGSASITGAVTAAGTGVGGAALVLRDEQGRVIAGVNTDSGGSWAFSGLPAGSYTVTLTLPAGYTLASDSSGAADGVLAVTVAAGQASSGHGIALTAPVTELAGAPYLSGATSSSLTWSWPSTPGIAQYQIQVDGGTWQSVGSALTATASGLTAGTWHVVGLRGVDASGQVSAVVTAGGYVPLPVTTATTGSGSTPTVSVDAVATRRVVDGAELVTRTVTFETLPYQAWQSDQSGVVQFAASHYASIGLTFAAISGYFGPYVTGEAAQERRIGIPVGRVLLPSQTVYVAATTWRLDTSIGQTTVRIVYSDGTAVWRIVSPIGHVVLADVSARAGAVYITAIEQHQNADDNPTNDATYVTPFQTLGLDDLVIVQRLSAPAADSVAPVLSGAPQLVASTTTIAVTLPAATDAGGLSHYEISIDGTTWLVIGDTLTTTIRGLQQGTSYTVRARAVDRWGNVSGVIQATTSTLATSWALAFNVTGRTALGQISAAEYAAYGVPSVTKHANSAYVGVFFSLSGDSMTVPPPTADGMLLGCPVIQLPAGYTRGEIWVRDYRSSGGARSTVRWVGSAGAYEFTLTPGAWRKVTTRTSGADDSSAWLELGDLQELQIMADVATAHPSLSTS